MHNTNCQNCTSLFFPPKSTAASHFSAQRKNLEPSNRQLIKPAAPIRKQNLPNPLNPLPPQILPPAPLRVGNGVAGRVADVPASTSRLLLVKDFLDLPPGHREAPTGSSVVTIPNDMRPGNLKSLGLLSFPGSGGLDYVVAELRVDPGVRHARLLFVLSGSATWAEKHLLRPDMPGRTSMYWGWKSDDVVCYDGKLWWVNLRRGLPA